jgi:hypothetical protein
MASRMLHFSATNTPFFIPASKDYTSLPFAVVASLSRPLAGSLSEVLS